MTAFVRLFDFVRYARAQCAIAAFFAPCPLDGCCSLWKSVNVDLMSDNYYDVHFCELLILAYSLDGSLG